MTRRHTLVSLLTLTLLSPIFALLAAAAEPPVPCAVPIFLKEYTLSGWQKGGGVYRAYTYNSEVDPCLYVETVRYGTKPRGVIGSRTICGITTGGEHYDLKQDVAASEISHLRWEGATLHFLTQFSPLRASAQTTLHCTGMFNAAAFDFECLPAKPLGG